MSTVIEDELDEAGQAMQLAAEEMGKDWNEIAQETGLHRSTVLRIRKNERRTPKYVRILENYFGWPRLTVKDLEAKKITVEEAVELTASREDDKLESEVAAAFAADTERANAVVADLETLADNPAVHEPTDEELLARLTHLRSEIDRIMVQLAVRARRRSREREG